MAYVRVWPELTVWPGTASLPSTSARALAVLSTAGVGLVAVHAGSWAWQLPWSVVTKLLISVVLGGRVSLTLTVKVTSAVPGPPAVAAGTGTFLAQVFGNAVAGVAATHPVQSPSGPA